MNLSSPEQIQELIENLRKGYGENKRQKNFRGHN